LAENIEVVSQELIEQEELITRLRNENRKLRFTKQSLEQELKQVRRLAEMRKENVPFRRNFENEVAPD
jgi:hypothetical protein